MAETETPVSAVASSEEPIYGQVVELLNQAQRHTNSEEKLVCLRKVLELTVYREPGLLDNFLDEVLSFQNDRSVDVRKFLLKFMEEACKKDSEILSKIVANLVLMLPDENVNVQKQVIMASEQLYQLALKWVVTARNVTDIMENTWDYFVQLKNCITSMVNSENDGVRTRALKFMETCILLQSCHTEYSESVGAFMLASLDHVPRDHRFISYRKLEAEGRTMFQKLLDVITAPHISSINLITCIAALSRIARMRPEFMEKTVIAFETVQVNIPPSLAKAQVSSVRKELKKHLLLVLKHPAARDYTQQIATLLTDLGATQAQINKAMPPPVVPSESRKRSRRDNGGTADDADDAGEEGAKKRARPVPMESQMDEDDEGIDLGDDSGPGVKKRRTSIDITADDLFFKLTPENVADLVLLSMLMLPENIPAQFQSSYTPIAAAGTPSQIKHLARLMAAQFTAVGLGPGAELAKQKDAAEASMSTSAGGAIEKEPALKAKSSVSNSERGISGKKPNMVTPAGFQSQKTSKRLHQFGLAHITKPMTANQLLKMTCMAFERVMQAEKRVKQGGAQRAHMKLLVSMVTQFSVPNLYQMLLDYIVADQKCRADLAILWVYQEYAGYQGFNKSLLQDTEKGLEKYNDCLTRLLGTLFQRGDHKETLFHRILLEAPEVTPAAQNILKKACEDPVHGSFSLDTLRQMILRKPRQRTEFLAVLLEFTTYEVVELRRLSLEIARELYENKVTKESVSWHMTMYLRYLLAPTPPNILFGHGTGRLSNPGKWEENAIKSCLYLHLSLLPVDHGLIHELASVYMETSADVKRVILRQLEIPIKAIGMRSKELLRLVETCPKGSETLVTRIVHLLTERSVPSVELVNRVRELYDKRVHDVRFLIPVLTGLTKKEIITALPKLIKLKENVVKEVLNRLLHGQGSSAAGKPLSPSELLIALHMMDLNLEDGKREMKYVIDASNHLLSDKNLYTPDVLANVIQQLVDQNPLPILLMRTVIQALSMYSRLTGFLMNILQRLIMKQVWKQPRVWEGFVRCCEKTQPQSFQVLLQLPPAQLKQVFVMRPAIREPLLQHITSLSAHQQAHISQSIMRVVQTDPTDYSEYQQQQSYQSFGGGSVEHQRITAIGEGGLSHGRLSSTSSAEGGTDRTA